jgi:hypothetical protein
MRLFLAALLALLAVPPHDAAPLAGSAGWTYYWDHERADLVSWVWNGIPEGSEMTGLSIELYVKSFDSHLDITPFSYGAYDSSTDPP